MRITINESGPPHTGAHIPLSPLEHAHIGAVISAKAGDSAGEQRYLALVARLKAEKAGTGTANADDAGAIEGLEQDPAVAAREKRYASLISERAAAHKRYLVAFAAATTPAAQEAALNEEAAAQEAYRVAWAKLAKEGVPTGDAEAPRIPKAGDPLRGRRLYEAHQKVAFGDLPHGAISGPAEDAKKLRGRALYEYRQAHPEAQS